MDSILHPTLAHTISTIHWLCLMSYVKFLLHHIHTPSTAPLLLKSQVKIRSQTALECTWRGLSTDLEFSEDAEPSDDSYDRFRATFFPNLLFFCRRCFGGNRWAAGWETKQKKAHPNQCSKTPHTPGGGQNFGGGSTPPPKNFTGAVNTPNENRP